MKSKTFGKNTIKNIHNLKLVCKADISRFIENLIFFNRKDTYVYFASF
jgi:hypothetical protein